MPLPFRPRCQPTHLGPLPHEDVDAAWYAVLGHMPDLPALPILVNQGETLARLSAESFVGAHIAGDDAVLDRKVAERSFDALYAAYLRGKGRTEAIDVAAMPQLLPSEQTRFRRARALWGMVLGPVSLALTLVDDQSEPALNDRAMLDALAKHVFLRQNWLRTMLERMGKPGVMWVYEPYLVLATSAFTPRSLHEIADAVDQALGTGKVRALWLPDDATALALHELLVVDVLGLPLPAPEHAAAFAPLVQQLLAQRAAIGWGIVPVTAEGLRSATVGRLAARFETWLRALEAQGLPPTDVLSASLVMPEDTLAYLQVADAERALAFTSELSSLIRQSYGVD